MSDKGVFIQVLENMQSGHPTTWPCFGSLMSTHSSGRTTLLWVAIKISYCNDVFHQGPSCWAMLPVGGFRLDPEHHRGAKPGTTCVMPSPTSAWLSLKDFLLAWSKPSKNQAGYEVTPPSFLLSHSCPRLRPPWRFDRCRLLWLWLFPLHRCFSQ